MIENTSERDPLLHLLGMMSGGQESYITDMEKKGQSEVVRSETLPTQGDWDAAELIGIVRGEAVDDLFTSVTLPEGWTRRATDHAMWSDILDERGVKRIAVGYKAAFYDRWAQFTVLKVGQETASDMAYNVSDDGKVTLPKFWGALTRSEKEDVLMSAHRLLASRKEEAEVMKNASDPSYWTDQVVRYQRVVEYLENEAEF